MFRTFTHDIPQDAPATGHYRFEIDPLGNEPGVPVAVRVIRNGEVHNIPTRWERRTIQFEEPLMPGDQVSIIFHPIETF